jgi:SNF family Na+-dependent transporter
MMAVWIFVYLLTVLVAWFICYVVMSAYDVFEDNRVSTFHMHLKQMITALWIAIFWPISFLVINAYCLFIIVKDGWKGRNLNASTSTPSR